MLWILNQCNCNTWLQLCNTDCPAWSNLTNDGNFINYKVAPIPLFLRVCHFITLCEGWRAVVLLVLPRGIIAYADDCTTIIPENCESVNRACSCLITSLAKEVMFLVALVCLFVCLFVCGQHYSKSYERIGMKFYGRVLSSTSKNWLNFGGDLGNVRWVNEHKNTVIVVAYPDRGEGNDPEPFFFFRGVGSLSQPGLNIFTVDNMGVMICLGQGGLRSLSASSC